MKTKIEENLTCTINAKEVKLKVSTSDLMLVEIMRSVGSGEIDIQLKGGKPKFILVVSRN